MPSATAPITTTAVNRRIMTRRRSTNNSMITPTDQLDIFVANEKRPAETGLDF